MSSESVEALLSRLGLAQYVAKFEEEEYERELADRRAEILRENQLEGAVPASALAKLTALKQFDIQKNEGLWITASGTQEIERAAPKAKFWWPRVVDA